MEVVDGASGFFFPNQFIGVVLLVIIEFRGCVLCFEFRVSGLVV